MRKGGIRIWGGAIAIVGALAAAGILANNKIKLVNGTDNTGAKGIDNTSIHGTGNTVNINTLPPSAATPSLKPSPDPMSSPTAQPSSPILPPSKNLEAECAQFGVPRYDYTKLISIANKAEEPKFRFLLYRRASRSVVCKIVKNSGELSLAYGLPDNSLLSRAVLTIYVDGTLRKRVDVGRGEAIREKVDIANASTYKLEFSVPENTSTQDYVYNLSK